LSIPGNSFPSEQRKTISLIWRYASIDTKLGFPDPEKSSQIARWVLPLKGSSNIIIETINRVKTN
jgi:hypothetical protein